LMIYLVWNPSGRFWLEQKMTPMGKKKRKWLIPWQGIKT
jgi:hypothetical protein